MTCSWICSDEFSLCSDNRDLNVDLLSERSHKLLYIMRLNCLSNIIMEPTRKFSTRQSLLNPIIVSWNLNYFDSYVITIDQKVNDHEGTIINLKTLFQKIINEWSGIIKMLILTIVINTFHLLNGIQYYMLITVWILTVKILPISLLSLFKNVFHKRRLQLDNTIKFG